MSSSWVFTISCFCIQELAERGRMENQTSLWQKMRRWGWSLSFSQIVTDSLFSQSQKPTLLLPLLVPMVLRFTNTHEIEIRMKHVNWGFLKVTQSGSISTLSRIIASHEDDRGKRRRNAGWRDAAAGAGKTCEEIWGGFLSAWVEGKIRSTETGQCFLWELGWSEIYQIYNFIFR